MRACTCAGWNASFSSIAAGAGMLALMGASPAGVRPFVYCPWCGSLLDAFAGARKPHDSPGEAPALDGIPTFPVTPKGGILVAFTCPKCGKENVHGRGVPRGGKATGHRKGHCDCWPRGYYIEER